MTTIASPMMRLEPATTTAVPPLVAGDYLDQPTFHERYLAMPEGTRAELIEGIVYMSSPVSYGHSRPHNLASYWLTHYETFTPGVAAITDGTAILGPRSEPQPDAALFIMNGGQTRLTIEGYVAGCPELVIEVAHSTEAVDLHAKRRDYDRAGAVEYVVTLTRTPRVVWFARDAAGRLAEVPPDADGLHRSIAFPGLWLDPAALLASDARRLREAVERGVATDAHAAFVADLAGRQT